MSNEDKMNIDERRKYLRRMKKRYVQAGRKEQGHLLDEIEAVTELHRKSLIRLMNGSLERKPHQKQRGRTLRQAQGRLYGLEVEYALSVMAGSSNYICAERLTQSPNGLANRYRQSHREGGAHPHLTLYLDGAPMPVYQALDDRQS
jgi:hypothetical protein